MNLSKPEPTIEKPKAQESSLLDWFMVDFWPRFGKQSTYALIGIAIIVSATVWFKNDRIASQAKENKLLGPAYILYSEDKLDAAEVLLNEFIKGGHTRLAQDKANLMLGQIYFNQGKYDEAIRTFGKVDLSGSATSLVSSGALHGLASSQMQKKEYNLAVENLEKFVSKYGRRTGAPSEKVEGQEVVDLSPVVPNALWKLTLCYRELKNVEKEKATAAKLMKIYPESKEAFDATRLFAQLP
jgi:TolA-binding protein